MLSAGAVGIDQSAVDRDHPADQLNRVLTALYLERVEPQVHVVPEFPAVDHKRDIRPPADAGVYRLYLFHAVRALQEHFSPLFICQQAQPEAASTAVGPPLVLDYLVAVLIGVSTFDVAVAD